MVTVVVEILGLILPLLITYLRQQDSAGQEATDVIQRGREALAKGDGDSFAAIAADQHDRVQQALRRHKRN